MKSKSDGGPESSVWGYWLCEWKKLLSVVLLRFNGASREAFHNHAFNSISWVLKGELAECTLELDGHNPPPTSWRRYRPSFRPVVTKRSTFHQVHSVGRTWVLSFRGPWLAKWLEYIPKTRAVVTLTHGRQVVSEDVPSHSFSVAS